MPWPLAASVEAARRGGVLEALDAANERARNERAQLQSLQGPAGDVLLKRV